MVSFIVTALLGVVQFFILKSFLESALSGKMKKMCLMLLLKFALYGTVIPLVFIVINENIYLSAAGFCLGIVGTVAVYGVKQLISGKKQKTDGIQGDDGIGSVSDD